MNRYGMLALLAATTLLGGCETAGLKGEVARVDTQVNRLVAELNAAIAEADRVIADLGKDGG